MSTVVAEVVARVVIEEMRSTTPLLPRSSPEEPALT
jgi:hypothetical protein